MTIDLTEVPTGDLIEEISRRDDERSLAEALRHIRTWIQKKTPLAFGFMFPGRAGEEYWNDYKTIPEDAPGLHRNPFKFIIVDFKDDRLTLIPAMDRPPYQAQKAIRIASSSQRNIASCPRSRCT